MLRIKNFISSLWRCWLTFLVYLFYGLYFSQEPNGTKAPVPCKIQTQS